MDSLRLNALALFILALLLLPNTSGQTSSSPTVRQQLTGLVWNGGYFLASYGESTAYLLNVSLDFRTVAPFAKSFSGWNETYIAIGDGTAGFPKGDVFVSSNQSIYEISPSGDALHVLSRPPGVSRLGFLAFDRVGTWGRALFAVDDDGLLWSILSNGTAKVIHDFGKGVKPEGVVVAPPTFGKFGGYLFVSLEYAKRIMAVAPGDASKAITVAQITGEAPERIMSIPPNSDLFIAKWQAGNALRVDASSLSKYTGSLLVITEGDSEANGSLIAMTEANGGTFNQTRIFVESDHPHFEAADFVPVGLSPPFVNGGASTSSDSPPANLATTEVAAVLLIVAAVVLVLAAIGRRRRLKIM